MSAALRQVAMASHRNHSPIPAEAATRLQDELAWFAAELGEVRDREVLRSRLARAVDDLPAYLVVGPVGEQIDEVLLTELRQHADALLATMRDERYRTLIADLARWREQPAFTPAAAGPPGLLADYLDAAERKLAKRMKRASLSHASASSAPAIFVPPSAARAGARPSSVPTATSRRRTTTTPGWHNCCYREPTL